MDSFSIDITKEEYNDSAFLDMSLNKEEEIIKKCNDSFDSLSFIFDLTPITTKGQGKQNKIRKFNKELLNSIPIPIFECIYCANEEIASKHLVLKILSSKYANRMDISDNLKNTIIKDLMQVELNHLNIEAKYQEVNEPTILNRKRNRE